MLQTQIIADPDLEQAIADFLPTAAEIRDRSAKILKLPIESGYREVEAQQVRTLMADVITRAGRLGISGDAFMVLLNDALDAKARRGRDAPARPTSRSLLTNLVNAEAALRDAQLEHQTAAVKMRAAAKALAAAETAYRAFAGGSLVHTEQVDMGDRVGVLA